MIHIKKIIFPLFIAALLISSCQKEVSESELADRHLQKALAFVKENQPDSAKSQIDSLNQLYPKEVTARKAARKLLVEINLQEETEKLQNAEQTLPAEQEAFDKAVKNFILRKDAQYESTGNYIPRNQVSQSSAPHLEAKVDEDGKLVITSWYAAAMNLQHNHYVLLTGRDFIESDTVSDQGYRHSFRDEELYYEIVSHTNSGKNDSIAEFLKAHEGKRIRVSLYGARQKYDFLLTDAEKKGIVQSAEFSHIFSRLLHTRRTIDVAKKKIDLYNKELAINQSE